MYDVVTAVKTAARIRHSLLDSEIHRLEIAARDELIRAGVPDTIAVSEEALIVQAVVTKCLVDIVEEKYRERYEQSWTLQLDNLRKHTWL